MIGVNFWCFIIASKALIPIAEGGMFDNWYIACKLYNTYPPVTTYFEVHPMTDKFWEFINDLN
jgi:hypothetical protein